jgi:hypothetical protein
LYEFLISLMCATSPIYLIPLISSS